MLTSNDMSTSRTSATLVSGAVRAKHLREKPILSSGITIHIFAELIIAVNLQQNTGTSSLATRIALQENAPAICSAFLWCAVLRGSLNTREWRVAAKILQSFSSLSYPVAKITTSVSRGEASSSSCKIRPVLQKLNVLDLFSKMLPSATLLFLEPNHGNSLVLDELSCTKIAHGSIIHGVYNLAIKHLRSLVHSKPRDSWHITELPNAQNYKIKLINLIWVLRVLQILHNNTPFAITREGRLFFISRLIVDANHLGIKPDLRKDVVADGIGDNVV
nr:hypothetical protein Iba_chr11aCG6730 [Ipomoea batatas]